LKSFALIEFKLVESVKKKLQPAIALFAPILLVGCSAMTKRDYAQDTRLSRAMNIARAAGISKAGDGLEDYTGKQWQELVGLVPSYIGTPKAPAGGGPGSAAGQAIELAVGTALAIASPNPHLGIGGSVASNAAMGYGGPNYNRQAGTITSAMASAPPPAKFNIPANIHDFLGFGLDDPNIPHLFFWPDRSSQGGDDKDAVFQSIQSAAAAASGIKSLEPAVEWFDPSLNFRENHFYYDPLSAGLPFILDQGAELWFAK